ncbi:hypothetical protein, partial [Neobacillus drentensis]|uniref:hypothetical protein n=1 Tax=Neobacillus drentensis TaxID=220684 RepID=UPI0008354691
GLYLTEVSWKSMVVCKSAYPPKRIRLIIFTHTINVFLKKEMVFVGRTKLGNANAQRNNNSKKPMRDSEELVEFTTGEALKHNRPNSK